MKRCSSSPRGRRPRLPDGLGTAALPPQSPPAGRFARDGTRTVLVEGRLRRSVPAPALLLSCRPDHAGSTQSHRTALRLRQPLGSAEVTPFIRFAVIASLS